MIGNAESDELDENQNPVPASNDITLEVKPLRIKPHTHKSSSTFDSRGLEHGVEFALFSEREDLTRNSRDAVRRSTDEFVVQVVQKGRI